MACRVLSSSRITSSNSWNARRETCGLLQIVSDGKHETFWLYLTFGQACNVFLWSNTIHSLPYNSLILQVHTLVEKNNVVRDDWNGYNVLHDSASRVAAMDLGFLKSASASRGDTPTKFVYLLGSDDFSDSEVPSDAFVVYQVTTHIFVATWYVSNSAWGRYIPSSWATGKHVMMICT